MSNLPETLQNISSNLLRNQSIPDDLTKLWKAKLDGRAGVIENLGLELFDHLEPTFFIGYRAEDGVPMPTVRAFERVFDEIAWVAKHEDGDLYSYWLGEERGEIAASPVVKLDTEGQFGLIGSSIAASFLSRTYDDPAMPEQMRFTVVRDGLAALGITGLPKTFDEIWGAFDALVQPGAQLSKYQTEEESKGG
jgi:hypothetical protein